MNCLSEKIAFFPGVGAVREPPLRPDHPFQELGSPGGVKNSAKPETTMEIPWSFSFSSFMQAMRLPLSLNTTWHPTVSLSMISAGSIWYLLPTLLKIHDAWKHEGKPRDKCYDQCPNQQHNEERCISTCGLFHIDFTQRTGNQKTDSHGR